MCSAEPGPRQALTHTEFNRPGYLIFPCYILRKWDGTGRDLCLVLEEVMKLRNSDLASVSALGRIGSKKARKD